MITDDEDLSFVGGVFRVGATQSSRGWDRTSTGGRRNANFDRVVKLCTGFAKAVKLTAFPMCCGTLLL